MLWGKWLQERSTNISKSTSSKCNANHSKALWTNFEKSCRVSHIVSVLLPPQPSPRQIPQTLTIQEAPARGQPLSWERPGEGGFLVLERDTQVLMAPFAWQQGFPSLHFLPQHILGISKHYSINDSPHKRSRRESTVASKFEKGPTQRFPSDGECALLSCPLWSGEATHNLGFLLYISKRDEHR